jgi:hypothetical protein
MGNKTGEQAPFCVFLSLLRALRLFWALMTGRCKTRFYRFYSDCCLFFKISTALEIALTAAKLSPEGLKTLRYVAKGLLTQLPKTPE